LDGGEDLPQVVYPGSTLDSMIRSECPAELL